MMGKEIIIPISRTSCRKIMFVVWYLFCSIITSVPFIFIIFGNNIVALLWVLLGGWIPLFLQIVYWNENGQLPSFKCKCETISQKSKGTQHE